MTRVLEHLYVCRLLHQSSERSSKGPRTGTTKVGKAPEKVLQESREIFGDLYRRHRPKEDLATTWMKNTLSQSMLWDVCSSVER